MLWDFDGTLAERPGLWSGCMLEVLIEQMPGHGISSDAIREGLRDGFPWHRPEIAHPELSDPQAWWDRIGKLLSGALIDAGLSARTANDLVPMIRRRFVDPALGWHLFEDTVPALRATRAAGWSNVVVSNHVPELAAIVSGLGLDGVLDAVFSSAVTGYEKPNSEAFRQPLRALGNPEIVFMVGDNPVADVAGAEALGLNAILVRSFAEVRHRSDDLLGAVEIILAS